MKPTALIRIAIAVSTLAVLVVPRGSRPRTITFTVWGMPFEDRLFLDGYARGFEASHPGVEVDYQRHFDINMKYNAWHARAFGPEVMRIMVTDYHDMVARGMLEPLDAYVNAPQNGLPASDLASFPGRLLDALRIDGHIYALPQDTSVLGLYYNKDLFDAAGLAYPNPSWTWDDLRSAARKLTRLQSRPIIRGIDLFMWQWPFMHLFAQAGGTQWTSDGLTTLINARGPDGSPGPGVQALEFLRALAHEDHSWAPSFGKDQGTGPDSRFANGTAAMYLDGSWMVPSFETRAPDLRFGVTTPPRGTTDAILGGSCLWAISAHARNKDAGWSMLHWLVAPEQAIEYWDALRVAPPANIAVIASPAFRTTRGIPGPGGGFEVPPMPESRFLDRAAWLQDAFRPDPTTGLSRVFVPAGLYQRLLEDEMARMLREYLESPSGPAAQTVLDRAARNVHQAIDRDRAARGLPPVPR